MEEKDQPQVGKVLQPSDRFGTITGGQQLKGGPRFRYQAGCRGMPNFSLKQECIVPMGVMDTVMPSSSTIQNLTGTKSLPS
jgi:hypothetical protein